MSDRGSSIEDLTAVIDLARLRSCTEVLVDAARRLMRDALTADEHPLDAIQTGIVMLESYLAAMSGTGFQSPRRYAQEIESALGPAITGAGADKVWTWLLTPNPGLAGRTPLQTLANHGLDAVAKLAAEQLAPARETRDDVAFDYPTAFPQPGYPKMSLEQFHVLQGLGLTGPVELLAGVVTLAGEPLVFGAAAQRRAAAAGVRVWGAADEVLADEELRVSVAAALAAEPDS